MTSLNTTKKFKPFGHFNHEILLNRRPLFNRNSSPSFQWDHFERILQHNRPIKFPNSLGALLPPRATKTSLWTRPFIWFSLISRFITCDIFSYRVRWNCLPFWPALFRETIFFSGEWFSHEQEMGVFVIWQRANRAELVAPRLYTTDDFIENRGHSR